MFYVEHVWKENIDRLIRTEFNHDISWARYGNDVITELDVESVGGFPTDLSLVCLFNKN